MKRFSRYVPAAVLALLIPFDNAHARTLHVPTEYPKIQAAMNAATWGDTVLVACGTYTWTSEAPTDEAMVVMKSGVTLRSESGSADCVRLDAEARGVVILCRDADHATRIEGLTLRGGHRYSGGPTHAIDIRNSAVQVSDCAMIETGDGYDYGAVNCQQSAAVFRRCRFTDNHASPAALFAPASAVQVEDCVFEENVGRSVVDFLFSDGAAITGCVFARNAARSLDLFDSGVTVSRTTFLDHVTTSAPIVTFRSEIALDQCIIQATSQRPGVQCDDSHSTIDMTCCDVYSGDETAWSGCIAGLAGVAGNFSADPLFCDPESHDYALYAGSPCLPGHHPEGVDCGRIGAATGECGSQSAISTTWGVVKTMFR